jgi:mannose-6-phosphate isomerase-like protein (cupin superfamily)
MSPAHSGASQSHLVNQPSAKAPLSERVGHSDPSKYVEFGNVHSGAGTMRFASLLEGTDFSANLFFVHRGVLLPGGGIGHHFHNTCEEMYVIFDNEAEFTIDGRTTLLSGPAAAPCRLGHSHAIYNRSSTPTEFMNICVSARKSTYDTFDLGDDRVDCVVDEKPTFMSIRLDSGVVDGDGPTLVKRLLVPGVLLGPWRYVDYIAVGPAASHAEAAKSDVEEFVYVLAGRGRVVVGDDEAAVSAGDAVPVLHGQARSFHCEAGPRLELMVVGIEVT